VRGYDLVTLVFAREASDDLTGLVKRIDALLDDTMTRQKRTQRLGVFVIFLNGHGVQSNIKALAEKEGLKQVVLSTFQNDAGPPRYRVARDAHLTVAVYNGEGPPGSRVTANFVVNKGGLTKGKTDEIYKAVMRALPK
jgi:hypothetical protein